MSTNMINNILAVLRSNAFAFLVGLVVLVPAVYRVASSISTNLTRTTDTIAKVSDTVSGSVVEVKDGWVVVVDQITKAQESVTELTDAIRRMLRLNEQLEAQKAIDEPTVNWDLIDDMSTEEAETLWQMPQIPIAPTAEPSKSCPDGFCPTPQQPLQQSPPTTYQQPVRRGLFGGFR